MMLALKHESKDKTAGERERLHMVSKKAARRIWKTHKNVL